MKTRPFAAAAAALAGMLLAGCSDGGAPKQDFEAFVKQIVADTSNTTEPKPVNGVEFVFPTDPHAFDDLFP